MFNRTAVIATMVFFSIPLLMLPQLLSAQSGSGACSWHSGVNCSLGRQPNGKVYCNDGWTESIVEYDFVLMCRQTDTVENLIYMEYIKDQRDIRPIQIDVLTNTDYDWCMANMYKDFRYIQRLDRCTAYQEAQTLNRMNDPTCPANSSLHRNYLSGTYYCVCNEGYYNYRTQGFEQQGYCQKGNPPFRIDKWAVGINQSSPGSNSAPMPVTGSASSGGGGSGSTIASSPRFISTLRLGSSGDEVLLLQTVLKKLHHFDAEPTGYFGSKTRTAVMALQRAGGLETAGIVGPKTRELLNKAISLGILIDQTI